MKKIIFLFLSLAVVIIPCIYSATGQFTNKTPYDVFIDLGPVVQTSGPRLSNLETKPGQSKDFGSPYYFAGISLADYVYEAHPELDTVSGVAIDKLEDGNFDIVFDKTKNQLSVEKK